MEKEFKLTKKYQFRKKCKDGCSRNYIIYFLNDVQILKQKYPYDETHEPPYDTRMHITNDYLLNGYIHQTRTIGSCCGMSEEQRSKLKSREVKFPVSKKFLNELSVPNDLKI